MLHHRFSLPVFSGILFALVFYPFYLWPLAFVALVPLFYFAGTRGRTAKELFLGGFLTGIVGIGPLAYSSLFQMRTLGGVELFSQLVRASSVPVLVGMAAAAGLLALAYGVLRSQSIVLNALMGAALYGFFESLFFFVFGGYNLAALSYAVVQFSPALALASVGGAALVSVCIGWGNALVAESVRLYKTERKIPYVAIAAFMACFVFVCAIGKTTAEKDPSVSKVVSAAVIQLPYENPQDRPYGTYENGVFTDISLEPLLKKASAQSSLLIYPFTPVKGATYDTAPASQALGVVPDQALGVWLMQAVPASTTVLVWNTAAIGGILYDQYALWDNGEESTYQKRQLYALSDYAPEWLSYWGLHGHTYTISSGNADNQALFDGVPIGGLICSELHQPVLAKREAARSPFIVAVGSDAMFPGDLMGNFSLAAARYRAAENGETIVRGNINGPSAFINPDGSIQNSLGYLKEGILYGSLPLSGRNTTFYAIWGSWPARVFVAALLILSAILRFRKL